MKPPKLYEALRALIGERVPLHTWGPCGIGKSQIVGQVASDLEYEFLDVRAVQLDPVDLRGLPQISSDQTEAFRRSFSLPCAGRKSAQKCWTAMNLQKAIALPNPHLV
jgi:MoxR-like ATPase